MQSARGSRRWRWLRVDRCTRSHGDGAKRPHQATLALARIFHTEFPGTALAARGKSRPCPAGDEASFHVAASFHVGASFHVAARFQPVGASFQLAHAFDKMKSCRHKRRGLQVFPCGCKFSNLHFPDKMKSCRHKSHRYLILSWFRAGDSDLIGRRRGLQRQGETNRQKSLWLENAARPRNRPVSPDGVHPTRAEIYPQILLRRLF